MINWAERERLVIEILEKGIPPKEIARQLKMSLRDVYKIRDKHCGYNEKKPLTTEHQAIMLIDKGKKPTEVAIELRISIDESIRYYNKYMDALHLGRFGKDYVRMKGYINEIEEISIGIKHAGMSVKELVTEFQLDRDLGQMEERHLYLLKGIEDAENKKETLQNSIQGLESKLKQLDEEIGAAEHRLVVANDFLNYSKPNNGYNYNYSQNQFAGNNQNYYRYW